jgi:hypothetical protein
LTIHLLSDEKLSKTIAHPDVYLVLPHEKRDFHVGEAEGMEKVRLEATKLGYMNSCSTN